MRDLSSRAAAQLLWMSRPPSSFDIYCFRAIVSWVIWSNVVTALASASKPRWATIRLANSVAMSTFDISKAPPESVPRPPSLPLQPRLAQTPMWE